MKSSPMTPLGYKKMQDELVYLKTVERHRIIKAISVAREHGDLSENAEYDAAKEAQALLEGRIKNLDSKLSRAQIIDPATTNSSKVIFGATVTIVDLDRDEEETWMIVGEDEANLQERKLGITSPIARALIGKSVGDEVNIVTPRGTKCCEVMAIKFIS